MARKVTEEETREFVSIDETRHLPEGVYTRRVVIALMLMAAVVGAILGHIQGIGQGINETLPALRSCVEQLEGSI